MKIHKYDDKYATKNGVNGVKEFLVAIIVGAVGVMTPTILLAIEFISFKLALIIYVMVILVAVYFIRKFGVMHKSTFSVLIENKDELYYMMITPDLRGSSLPKSVTALLAGPSATYVENKFEAAAVAAEMAQNNEIVTDLFNLYQKKGIKTTFDTMMNGKPIYVSKILDKNFEKEYKKFYKVNCIKDNGKKSTVIIPNVYPTFFTNSK